MLVSNSYGSVLSSNAVLAVLPSADFVPLTFVFRMILMLARADLNPALALDASNNVYVIDWLNNRVVKFTARRRVRLTQWGKVKEEASDGQFSISLASRWTAATTFLWSISETCVEDINENWRLRDAVGQF